MSKMNTTKIDSTMDQELVMKFQKGDKEAGAQFISNHYDEIVKVARFHCHKTGYDFDLGNDIYNDCISEAILATYEAMESYKPGVSKIMTHVNNKIMFSFMTLKRNNSKHSERYAPMSKLNGTEGTDGKVIDIEELLESQVDKDCFEESMQEKDMKTIVDHIIFDLEDDCFEKKALDLYYQALSNGEPNPIAYVCDKTGYTKQGVHAAIRRVAAKLDENMTKEIFAYIKAA